jgi:hypothetical protein
LLRDCVERRRDQNGHCDKRTTEARTTNGHELISGWYH